MPRIGVRHAETYAHADVVNKMNRTEGNCVFGGLGKHGTDEGGRLVSGFDPRSGF